MPFRRHFIDVFFPLSWMWTANKVWACERCREDVLFIVKMKRNKRIDAHTNTYDNNNNKWQPRRQRWKKERGINSSRSHADRKREKIRKNHEQTATTSSAASLCSNNSKCRRRHILSLFVELFLIFSHSIFISTMGFWHLSCASASVAHTFIFRLLLHFFSVFLCVSSRILMSGAKTFDL